MEFKSGEEKLEYEEQELLKNVDEKHKETLTQQYYLIFSELIKKCNDDEIFNSQVMMQHKSWNRCYKYIENKAREMCAKGSNSCAVVSTTLFQWIYEYYALDDKEDVENENKVIEKMKGEKKTKPKDIKEDEEKEDEEKEDETEEKEAIKVTHQTTKHSKDKVRDNLPGQMSIMDFLGV